MSAFKKIKTESSSGVSSYGETARSSFSSNSSMLSGPAGESTMSSTEDDAPTYVSPIELSAAAKASLFVDPYIYGARTRWWPWEPSAFQEATPEEMEEVAEQNAETQIRYRYLLERSKNPQEILQVRLNKRDATLLFTVGIEESDDDFVIQHNIPGPTEVLEENVDPLMREAFYRDNWRFMQKIKHEQRELLEARGMKDPALPEGFDELQEKLKLVCKDVHYPPDENCNDDEVKPKIAEDDYDNDE